MILREYKVKFRNNRPVNADPVDVAGYENVIKCSQKGRDRFINWLVVFGYDEKDAIINAKNMVRDFISPHIGLAH